MENGRGGPFAGGYEVRKLRRVINAPAARCLYHNKPIFCHIRLAFDEDMQYFRVFGRAYAVAILVELEFSIREGDTFHGLQNTPMRQPTSIPKFAIGAISIRGYVSPDATPELSVNRRGLWESVAW